MSSNSSDTNSSADSSSSRARRNKGKMKRDTPDTENKDMCDRSADMKHRHELAKADKKSTLVERETAIRKENQRHRKYTKGQSSLNGQR